jgi:Ca-activated chloride channel family protein
MKRSRNPIHPTQQSSFGLVAWLEATRVALPLRGVECRFQVTGAIASVELDQIYHQNAERPLDCTYTFPLPAGAAVYRCEVHINGRIIRAKVEDLKTARETFRTRKADGGRAALVETERENLFTLSLGNVQPGDVIVVCFAWFQVLDRAGRGLRLLVPTCPGVRYIPGKPLLRSPSGRGIADDTDQVPDASRISPPRIDALHPDAAYFSILGRLSASDVESGTTSSSSHQIRCRENGSAVTVELSSTSAVPDRDFVLVWQEPKALQLTPHAWHWTEGGETYALVQLRAPENVKVARNFAQDFYFLVDRSGSMSGVKWQKSCEALRSFVGLLGPEDRVWITLFESRFRDFSEAPMPAHEVLADEGFLNIERLGTTGGTEMLLAVTHLLGKIAVHSMGRHTSVVLITDGQAGNEDAVKKAFKPATNLRVHTFGIDVAVNDAFLKSLARQQRGGCWLQTPNDDIAGTVSALGDRLRRPVLHDLVPGGPWEAACGALPDIHAAEIVTVALRGTAAKKVKFTGRLPDNTAHSFTVAIGDEGSEALKLLWAQQRIAALLESGRQNEAIILAKTHNLICEGAAFIAWDEAEQVQVAEEEVVQPAFDPECQDSLMMQHLSARSHFAPQISQALVFDTGTFFPELASPSQEAWHDALKETLQKPLKARRSRSLREPTHDAGIKDLTFERFLSWHESSNTPERAEALLLALVMLRTARVELGDLFRHEWMKLQMPTLTAEGFLEWAERFQPVFDELVSLLIALEQLDMTPEMFERFASWAVESGEFDLERVKRASGFFNSLKHPTSSATVRVTRLRKFLKQTVGAGAEDFAAAWIQALAPSNNSPTVPS